MDVIINVLAFIGRCTVIFLLIGIVGEIDRHNVSKKPAEKNDSIQK